MLGREITPLLVATVASWMLVADLCEGFTPAHTSMPLFVNTQSLSTPLSSTTTLFMGKSINKQAELRKKMEMAKKQKAGAVPASEEADDQKKALSDQDIKERNDRLRFDELLKKSSAAVFNDYSSDGYLNKQQEEEEINAQRKGLDRIFEGDPAPTDCFQELVNVQTGNTIGKPGMEQLIPWLNSHNKNAHKDYLVCVSDPRDTSPELRDSVQNLLSTLPKQIMDRTVFINSDSPAENRRWMKRKELTDKIRVFSDEQRHWMRDYTALGEKRWSMTVFVISGQKVAKLAREVDSFAVGRTISKAIQSLQEERRLN